MAAGDAAILRDLWRAWSRRIGGLTDLEWVAPTRCDGWTVRELVAHVAPDPDALRGLASSTMEAPPAVDDAAVLLRRFNERDGVAHTMAGLVEQQARAVASARSRYDLRAAFDAAADVIDASPLPPNMVVPHPVAGSVTVEVLTEIALMEATVHGLDLAAAVGDPLPNDDALTRVAALLVRVAGPARVIDAATGRDAPTDVLPAIR